MITTLSYAIAARQEQGPIDCVATVAYWNRDGVRGLVYSPFDGPPAPAGVLARLQCLLADSSRKWDEFWQLLARHPWSREEWKKASDRAAGRYRLPKGSADEVLQAAQVTLCALLNSKADLRAWLGEPLQHFEAWFRSLLFNLSSAAARAIGRPSRLEARCASGAPAGERIEQIADYRRNESATDLDEMLSMLARYPEPTRSVILLRAQGLARNEVAQTLGITVEAARWAETKYLDDLRRDFACFR